MTEISGPALGPAFPSATRPDTQNGQLIALVGLPGVGKSTVGKRLALELGRVFIDTDAWIEATTGHSVQTLFEQQGEAAFRVLEGHALKDIAQQHPDAVIATGGGIVVVQAHCDFLRSRACTVYLNASETTLLARLKRNPNKRPLFRSGDVAAKLARMNEERRPLYRAVARLTCDLDGRSLNDTVSYLVAALRTQRNEDEGKSQ